MMMNGHGVLCTLLCYGSLQTREKVTYSSRLIVFFFPCGRNAVKNSVTKLFIRAFGILCKAHYVFNLDFHPYLTSFYNYIDSSYGMAVALTPSCKQLNAAVRNFQKNDKSTKKSIILN